jgi:phosphohistidine swiveling domain-containing protein
MLQLSEIAKLLPTFEKKLNRPNSIYFTSLKHGSCARFNPNLPYDYTFDYQLVISDDIYAQKSDLQALEKKLRECIEENGIEVLERIVEEGEKEIREFLEFSKKIGLYAQDMNAEELKRNFREYNRGLLSLMAYLWHPLVAEKFLEDRLNHYLDSFDFSPEEKRSLFLVFTTPSREGFLEQFEKALWELREGKADLREVHQEYSFFGDHFYQFDFLSEEDILERAKNARAPVQKNYGEECEAALEKLGADGAHRKEIMVLREYVFFRSYRLDVVFKSSYLALPLWKRVAEMLGVGLRDGVCFTYQELEDALDGELKLLPAEIAERKKDYLFFSSKNGMRVFSGTEVDSIRKSLEEIEARHRNLVELRGQPASVGYVVGRAKVLLSAKEISKVDAGDILVASMTVPDYVPAMRKAVGVVTDEGGVTCHAAIISRELGIPCVIGTRFATKAIRDGDLIELDATHGIVRKLTEKEYGEKKK